MSRASHLAPYLPPVNLKARYEAGARRGGGPALPGASLWGFTRKLVIAGSSPARATERDDTCVGWRPLLSLGDAVYL